MTRITKSEAGYQDEPAGEQYCARCVMFQPPHSCTKVMGWIDKRGWCRFFYAKKDFGALDAK